MQFQNSDRSVSLKGGLASRMFDQFRDPIRKILESGLLHLEELTTMVGKGEAFTRSYREEFVVNALGVVDGRTVAASR
jgi:hypothetical protein